MSEHQHEEWQLRPSLHGGEYCGACGERVTPTPDDAARAEAERLYPGSPQDDNGLTYPFGALIAAHRQSYVRGRADERARIAARRDEVVEAARAFIVQEVGDDMGGGMTDQAERLTDAFLAALGVSE